MGRDGADPRSRGGDDRDRDQQRPFARTLTPDSSWCLGLGLGQTRFEMGQKLGLTSVGPRPVHVRAHGLAHEGGSKPTSFL